MATKSDFIVRSGLSVATNATINNSIIVNGGAVNTVVNSTSIGFVNATATLVINSTSYGGTANNATNLGGTAYNYYLLANSQTTFTNTVTFSNTATMNAVTFNGVTGPQINIAGSTSSFLYFHTNGTGAPTVTTRSVGTKVILYPAISATSVDYGMGIDTAANTLWYSISTNASSAFFAWYANSTVVANLSGNGTFTVNSVNAQSITVSTNTFVIGSAAYYVSNGNFGVGNNVPTDKIRAEGALSALTSVSVSNSTVNSFVADTTGIKVANLTSNLFVANSSGVSVAPGTSSFTISTINTSSNGFLVNNSLLTLGNSSVNIQINSSSIYVSGVQFSGIKVYYANGVQAFP
jgi:hypothetical protein